MSDPHALSRRRFLKTSTAVVAGTCITSVQAQPAKTGIRVLHPMGRVPLSFIIDDSTCLVNMGHFCMPQFAAAWPERETYRQRWQDWPREIPDAFVREFGEWCAAHGVKGKYSIVPYPACVGWLDRELPGWSKRQLEDSLKLVRELMVQNWDIHPEMITHTRVIDLKTGRPMAEANSATMENSYPQQDVSVDYLASYLAYALKILKNCDLPCEGITTPGGFGNRVKDKLPIAVHQAVRDVYGTDLPHYFKYIANGTESTRPKLEYTDSQRSADRLTMNVLAGTGDWFGGWEGTVPSQGHRYANDDATAGRMVELIQRGEPAVMLCHWPGMYCNGDKSGFRDFQRVVIALAKRFSQSTIWMKPSEIGRYEAARQLTSLTMNNDHSIGVDAPYGCTNFTIELAHAGPDKILLHTESETTNIVQMPTIRGSNQYSVANNMTRICFDLPRGPSKLVLQAA